MATKKAANKGTTKPAPKRAAASKKTTPKKSPAKTTAVKSTTPDTKPETEQKTTTQSQQTVRLKKSYAILIVVILLFGAAIYYFRGLFVAAVVNGQPISRLEVVQQAEKQSGKQTLDTLVRDALIEQEAKKENVSVSDQEVNAEITTLQGNLKKQGQTLDQVLSTQGMSQVDLRRLIHKNKDSLPNTDDVTLKKQVKAQLTQQKTNTAVQSWLANIQQKANIVYFVQY